jgi:two-component system sensor histidine kinase PhoQ
LSNALADLAHSLKTPLAIMRGALGEAETAERGQILAETRPGTTADTLAEQVRRMDAIVAYQLERARGRPAAVLAPPIPLAPAVERILAALTKLHADRAVAAELDLEPGLAFRGAEGDLLEVIGNLLDNAFKWCRTRVRVRARREGGLLVLTVEDDGPGIPAELAAGLATRGARADLGTPGHGIGLAVVREICQAYGGDLTIDKSPLGGALVQARLGV